MPVAAVHRQQPVAMGAVFQEEQPACIRVAVAARKTRTTVREATDWLAVSQEEPAAAAAQLIACLWAVHLAAVVVAAGALVAVLTAGHQAEPVAAMVRQVSVEMWSSRQAAAQYQSVRESTLSASANEPGQ